MTPLQRLPPLPSYDSVISGQANAACMGSAMVPLDMPFLSFYKLSLWTISPLYVTAWPQLAVQILTWSECSDL